MAEYNIANSADVFSYDKNRSGPWICRDDSGNYWTVLQNTSQNLEIYKSLDSGATWTLKKTLTSADYTSLTMPVNNFNIVNLDGQNKVYIWFWKVSANKSYGWVINTLTDSGSVDLDGVTTQAGTALGASCIRWDVYNNKLWLVQGDWTLAVAYYSRITLAGGYDSTGNVNLSGRYYWSSAYNKSGDRYVAAQSLTPAAYYISLYKNVASLNTAKLDIPTFLIALSDYNGQGILMAIIGGTIRLWRANTGFTNFDLTDYNFTLSGGATCTAAHGGVDGLNNIYIIFTSSADGEAYFAKFDVTINTWGTPTQISTGNHGSMVSSELLSPLSSDKLLVTYQATA